MSVREKARQLIGLGGMQLRGTDDKLDPDKMKAELDAGLGQLNCFCRPLPPAEGVEQANEVQKYMLEETRLGIPVIIHDEILHGLVCLDSTSYPQSIALASTWNPDLAWKVGDAIGKETHSRAIHQGLAPTVNIARDARCGRVEETYGEDTWLSSRIAVNFVKGFQSHDLMATVKHFACNFVGDGGRDSHAVHFSERILREVYFPVFEACVREADALSIMGAYGSINGVPSSGDRWLLTDVLRNEWGFHGIVVSDYASINEMFTKHRTATSRGDAARQALEAGMEMEYPFPACFGKVEEIVESGELSLDVLDEAVARILRLKFDLGLFEEPYRDPQKAAGVCYDPANKELALETARQAVTLLKNDDAILPLKPEMKRIAVLGPNAATGRLGGYSAKIPHTVSPLEGIRNHCSEGVEVTHAEGCGVATVGRFVRVEDGDHFMRVSHNETVITSCEILPPTEDDRSGIPEAVKSAKEADVAVLCVGNISGDRNQTEGESEDRCSIDLPGVQEELIEAVAAVNPNVIVLLINGGPVTMERWVHKVKAVVECWYNGEEGGNAIGEILFGKTCPSGKLPVSFPIYTGQCPVYYNMKPSGRTYGYCDLRGRTFQFPFGHGLSYTTFGYESLKVEKTLASADEMVRVSFELTNTGDVDGTEVVQLYVHDEFASLARPLKELKAFQRVSLRSGETRNVELVLARSAFAMLDQDLRSVIEPGDFKLMLGASSEDVRLESVVTMTPDEARKF
ncbi:MAG: glycoside hydrolase family 3 N-terminal domain-containing protein [Chthoniobacterales bacterium]